MVDDIIRQYGYLGVERLSDAVRPHAESYDWHRPENNPPYREAVKLIHSDELQKLDKFPQYQQFEGTSYLEYQAEARRIYELGYKFRVALNADATLQKLNTDELVTYEQFSVDVKGPLFSRTKNITLQKPVYEDTHVSASRGVVKDGVLQVKAGWFTRTVNVKYSCKSHVRYAKEIAALKARLNDMSLEERVALREIKESRSVHPVLFVSHRWEDTDHPDPHGTQLEKLRQLKNCFIIYDYTSFPQDPLSDAEAEDLEQILQNMHELIRNVLILRSASYITRGWCLYEYIASSLYGSVVCDEIQDPKFVALRNWVSTNTSDPSLKNLLSSSAPLYLGKAQTSVGAMQQNQINQAILSGVNDIITLYKNAQFTVPQDALVVKKLLTKLLLKRLPAKKEYEPYLGEWRTISWTEEELANAFESELTWERLQSASINPFVLNVPRTIDEAVRREYKSEVHDPAWL
jgi:hypothetical protein